MKGTLLASVLLAGCQLPPQFVAGGAPDAGASHDGDLAAPPDLSSAHHHCDLAGADLQPPTLPGNTIAAAGSNLATLWLSVTDRDTGTPLPSRVIFRPPPAAGFADSIQSGEWDVNSSGSSTGAVVARGVVGSPEGVLLATGIGQVPVPEGSYELLITRGPEYELVDTHVAIRAGEVIRVDAELDRTVDTRGWLSADMHVHTQASFDSALPLDRRVISMTSNGVDLIVTTEHNNTSDLSGAIRNLGYPSDLVGTIVGDEFNFAEGHGGAYPVAYDPSQPAGGVPEWTADPCMPGVGVQCTHAAQMFGIMHNQVPGMTAVTINHPYWAGADLGYFTNIDWGAGTDHPPPAPLETAGQFDALEVLNGYQANSDVIGYLITDWMFLLSQGYRVTALGNSDTHKINWVRAGWPRTYLRLPADAPGEVTGTMLGDAIRHQRAVATTGPFAELTVDGHPIGDTVVPEGATVKVELTVDAPDWMPLDVVRLYRATTLVHEFAVAPGHRPVFHTILDEPVDADTWFVLDAEGSQPLPPDIVGEVSHANGYEMQPFVLTNPVFVDADGDGQWHPPAWVAPPAPFTNAGRNNFDTRRHGPTPEGCSPGEDEPPLSAAQAAARYLAPLANP